MRAHRGQVPDEGEGEAGAAGLQAAQLLAQAAGQHRDDAVHEVHAGAPQLCLGIQRRPGPAPRCSSFLRLLWQMSVKYVAELQAGALGIIWALRCTCIVDVAHRRLPTDAPSIHTLRDDWVKAIAVPDIDMLLHKSVASQQASHERCLSSAPLAIDSAPYKVADVGDVDADSEVTTRQPLH